MNRKIEGNVKGTGQRGQRYNAVYVESREQFIKVFQRQGGWEIEENPRILFPRSV